MEQPTKFEDLVSRALKAYGIEDYDAHFIRHNENITHRVTDHATGQNYLLRIHDPVSPNLRGIQQTFEGLCGEIDYLTALAGGTNIKLQQPVNNALGSPITVIHDHANGYSSMATLLTWVDGETLDQHAGDIPALTRKIGALAAEMHAFAREWQEPRPFVRPVYDVRKYTHLVDRLAYGMELGLFREPAYRVLREAMEKITGILAPLAHSRQHWGVIHADLKGDNLIVAGNKLVPIDFSFSGYGYYLFDIGGCAPSLRPELRASLLQGYEQQHSLSESDLLVIRCCFLLAIFGGFAFSVTNRQRHEWIQRRVPAVAAGYCAKFLGGDEFLFE